jgi:hypothetical protein
MKVDIEIEGGAEALDQRHGAGRRTRARKARLLSREIAATRRKVSNREIRVR